MKYTLFIAFYFMAVNAFATATESYNVDKELGPVVAIEREVGLLQERCTASINRTTSDKTTPKPTRYFFCAIPYLEKNEVAVTEGRFLTHLQKDCHVLGTVIKGKVTFEFARIESQDPELANLCLTNALIQGNQTKVIVYKHKK